MSNFLLQKGLKLFKDTKDTKKTKKPNLQRLKRKKNWFAIKKIKEEQIEENILKNLQGLKQLHKQALAVPKEVLEIPVKIKENDNTCNLEAEESTVFTEKDFEEFEKEYLGS